MERAKFRWLHFASLLALGVSTGSVAGERHRIWVDPPSDLLARAAPDTWSDPSAKGPSAEPPPARIVSADTGKGTEPVEPTDPPSRTGSVTGTEAEVGTAATAPENGSGSRADAKGAQTIGATADGDTRTASRDDPSAAEPAPVRRDIDRERTRIAPRHAGRQARRNVRLSGRSSTFIERIFGPPRRGANVITTGSIR